MNSQNVLNIIQEAVKTCAAATKVYAKNFERSDSKDFNITAAAVGV